MDADRDRSLIEAGEPPWGDVVPGTDTVEYFTVAREIERGLLFRTVAMGGGIPMGGAFYVERCIGRSDWKVDSGPMTYLMSSSGDDFAAIPLNGRKAAQLMSELDRGSSAGQDAPID